MNVEEDYDDEKERAKTPASMLPRPEGPVAAPAPMHNGTMKARQQLSPALHHRSVLGGVTNPAEGTRLVTWNSILDRVNTNDRKALLRHLEVVKVKIPRARALNSKLWPRGRE